MPKPHRGYLFENDGMRAIHIGKPASWAAAFTDFIASQREGLCDVHWGHHSCARQAHHRSHKHVCVCGSVPQEWSVLRGEHLTRTERRLQKAQILELKEMEKIWAREDDFDHKGNYRG